jgi:hypothetical protein
MTADRSIAIVQSCYVPWKGYFDLIDSVDEFVLFDDRQFTKRDWRNRNRIKTARGTRWLTIPVRVKGRYTQRIDETEVSDLGWGAAHWRSIVDAYSSAPHFEALAGPLGELYASPSEPLLSAINRRFLEWVCDLLGITTRLTWSTEYQAEGLKTERLVSLCLAAGATRYVSGPAARAYLEESRFADAGIELAYFEYDGYPEYPQLHPPFEHTVSILDVLFHTGPDAPSYVLRRRPAVSKPHAA